MRTHDLDRWNWSEKAKKWVYVTLEDGERTYKYQLEPPEDFIKLTRKLRELNQKLSETEDPRKNREIYKELMKVSKRMQSMRK